jgi:hypothetical protein
VVLAGSDALRLSVRAFVAIVLLVLVLGWIETGRRRELTLLGNLGTSRLVISAFLTSPAVFGEIALRTAASIFA